MYQLYWIVNWINWTACTFICFRSGGELWQSSCNLHWSQQIIFILWTSADGLLLESEWQLVLSRHLDSFSILADLNKTIPSIISVRSTISSIPQPTYPALWIVTSPLVTALTPFTLIFHRFPWSLARPMYWSLFPFSLIFSVVNRYVKEYDTASPLSFLVIISRSGLLVGIRWFFCISKFQRILCVSFSWTDSGFCISVPHPISSRWLIHRELCKKT